MRTSSSDTTRSTIRGSVAREWINEPPSDSKNTSALQPPGAVLGDLARAAGRDVLVALAARLRVVDGSETVRAPLDLLEDESIVVERSQRHDRVLFERVEIRPLVEIAVREAVEARRRFGETPRRRRQGVAGGRVFGCRCASRAKPVSAILAQAVECASDDARGRCGGQQQFGSLHDSLPVPLLCSLRTDPRRHAVRLRCDSGEATFVPTARGHSPISELDRAAGRAARDECLRTTTKGMRRAPSDSDACANQTENVNARASFGGARRARNAVGDSRRASEHKVHLRALNERSWSLKSAAERSSSPTMRLCSPIAALRSIVARSLSSATASMHLR